ncbi:MAG: glutathione S-transferase [Gammaproteobacteria bacterium]|jgi:glutathione S-transferase
MKFYNAWYCPFAQRAWMALVHKKLDFEIIEVDPYAESDWWLKISRGASTVPVLIQANDDGSKTTIVESNRVVEYLEDYYPENPVFADHPNQRAEQKYWMDHVSNNITPRFYRFLRAVEPNQKQAESRDKMLAGMITISEAMDSTGPFFNGDELSAVDIAFFPFAFRIDQLLGIYRDFKLPTDTAVWRRYHEWYNAVLNHPSFKATATDHDNYTDRLIAHYLPHSLGEG